MQRQTWALITVAYLAFAEFLSWAPSGNLRCLIEPEHAELAANRDGKKYCPGFHAGIVAILDATDGFFERHDKSVVAGFTVVLALSTIGLWSATKKLWSAGEAQRTLAENTAERQLRAYVAATPNWIFRFSPMEALTVKIKIINHGQTPAYDMMSFSKVDVLPYPLPPDWTPPPLPADSGTASKSTLYSDAPAAAETTMRRLLTSEEIENLGRGGNLRVYAFGSIKYTDAFNRKRTTKFCRSIVPLYLKRAASGEAFESTDVVFETAQIHNESD